MWNFKCISGIVLEKCLKQSTDPKKPCYRTNIYIEVWVHPWSLKVLTKWRTYAYECIGETYSRTNMIQISKFDDIQFNMIIETIDSVFLQHILWLQNHHDCYQYKKEYKLQCKGKIDLVNYNFQCLCWKNSLPTNNHTVM